MDGAIDEWLGYFKNALTKNIFVKATLSKPSKGNSSLRNVYLRTILVKEEQLISFTFRNATNDYVKNFSLEEALQQLSLLLKGDFHTAVLFSIQADCTLQISKKGKASLIQQKPSFDAIPTLAHDREKNKPSPSTAIYLQKLGIADAQGNIIPKMADKYTQINKYLEIVDSLLAEVKVDTLLHIVDMGAGKGYLTFALYDYLTNVKKINATVTGVEWRDDLVAHGNKVAVECSFENLKFVSGSIKDFTQEKIDVLIALHACDTATDDAIFKGISAKASLIICAPCCHKQIRQQLKGVEHDNPMLKYGIFKERHFEMVTDTMRALLLEQYQYKTKIFEFVSNEHTRKNVLLTAVKTSHKVDEIHIKHKLETIKKDNNIKVHYLETLLK